MGQSTDALLVFGIPLEEETELPWQKDGHEDIDDWWLVATGFKATDCPFDADGEYLPGVGRGHPREVAYYEERSQWRATHPLPIEIQVHCHYDCPMYIVSVEGAELCAHRGHPKRLDTLPATPPDPERILRFIREYIEPEFPETTPAWWLCSMWG